MVLNQETLSVHGNTKKLNIQFVTVADHTIAVEACKYPAIIPDNTIRGGKPNLETSFLSKRNGQNRFET